MARETDRAVPTWAPPSAARALTLEVTLYKNKYLVTAHDRPEEEWGATPAAGLENFFRKYPNLFGPGTFVRINIHPQREVS